MTPPLQIKRFKLLQLAVTVLLASVLFAIAGGYIYYGMQKAKQAVDTVIPAATSSEQAASTSPELSEMQQRMQKLEVFAKQSSSTMTQEERMVVLESIAKEPTESALTEVERITILKSMENDTNQSTE